MSDVIHSWLPITISAPDGTHLHGLVWWEWNRPWKESLIPAGVTLTGLGPEYPGCEVCKHWGAPGGFGAAQHPKAITRSEVGDAREKLLQSTPETPEGPKAEVPTAREVPGPPFWGENSPGLPRQQEEESQKGPRWLQAPSRGGKTTGNGPDTGKPSDFSDF